MADLDDTPIIEQQLSSKNHSFTNLLKTALKTLKKLSVEPFILIWGFGHTLVATPTSSLYFDKVCKVGSVWFGNGSTYPDEVCDHIDNGTFDEVQDYVQETVADMHLVVSLCEGIPPIIFVLFIGPWSDNFGRKTLLILPIIGYLLYSIFYLFAVIFFYELPAEFLMLEIARDLLGGDMCLWMGAYSYIADVSAEKTRTMRIAFIDGFFFLSLSLGNGVSGIILTELGYTAIYSIAIGSHTVALIYCVVVMKDSRKQRDRRLQKMVKGDEKNIIEKEQADKQPNSMFSLENIKHSFGAALKKRPNGMRHIIILLIVIYGEYGFANNVYQLNNQYSRKKFEWGSTDEFNLWWSTYSAVGYIYVVFAIGVLLPIMTLNLKFTDTAILMISLSSTLIGTMTIQLAEVANILYLASALKMFSNVSTTTARSIMTKIVDPMEVGRVFACTAAIGAFATLANPIYQAVYSATLQWYFGFIYCISDMVLIVALVTAIYIHLFLRRLIKEN